MLEFLSKFEFLNKIFRRGETRQTARDRLRLVLIHDRASLSPQIMESLKEDLIHIISKYLEIDVNELEIGLEQKDGSMALAANIPIKKVKRTPDEGGPSPAETVPEEAPAALPEKKPATLSKPPAARDLELIGKKRASSREKRKSRIKRFSDRNPEKT